MPRSIGREVRDLIADAAAALRTGLEERINPLLAPRRHGVIVGGDAVAGGGSERSRDKARGRGPSRRDDERLHALLERRR